MSDASHEATDTPGQRHSVPAVLRAAAKAAGVPVAEITGRCQKAHLVRYRHAAYAAARIATTATFPRIAQLACRDHTSIMFGAKRADPAAVAEVLAALSPAPATSWEDSPRAVASSAGCGHMAAVQTKEAT